MKYQVEIVEITRRTTVIEVEATDTFDAEAQARKQSIPESKWQDDKLPMQRFVRKITRTQ